MAFERVLKRARCKPVVSQLHVCGAASENVTVWSLCASLMSPTENGRSTVKTYLILLHAEYSLGGLTAQIGWFGLRVGGHPALSLHSSNEPGELSQ